MVSIFSALLTISSFVWIVVPCMDEVAIPKPALKRQTITSCNIKDVVTEDLVKEFDLGTIEGEDINDLVNQLENKCKRALDTLAPEETKFFNHKTKEMLANQGGSGLKEDGKEERENLAKV